MGEGCCALVSSSFARFFDGRALPDALARRPVRSPPRPLFSPSDNLIVPLILVASWPKYTKSTAQKRRAVAAVRAEAARLVESAEEAAADAADRADCLAAEVVDLRARLVS